MPQGVNWFLQLCIPSHIFIHATTTAQQFIEGVKVNDVKALEAQRMNSVAVGETISTLFSRMIFFFGLVHCDPVSLHSVDQDGQEECIPPANPPIPSI